MPAYTSVASLLGVGVGSSTRSFQSGSFIFWVQGGATIANFQKRLWALDVATISEKAYLSQKRHGWRDIL
jgi:hypothetical protein